MSLSVFICQAIQTMFRIQERILNTHVQTEDGSFTLSDICLLAEVSCSEIRYGLFYNYSFR